MKSLHHMTSFAGPTPRCTDYPTYKLWRIAAASCRPDPKVGFCVDCTPEYQAGMNDDGRCENPWVIFKRDEHGFLCGAIPSIQQQELSIKKENSNV